MSSATVIPSIKLNDGVSMPILGYGTGTAWFKTVPDNNVNRELVESIKSAIKLGYYHLDGAEVYNTEVELGIAIRESGVEREKLFVTTKVMTNVSDIPKAIDISLKKLQLDYVDLYLIHSPYFAKSDSDLQKAWAAMEKIKETGKVRSIGVSNFLQSNLEVILKTAKIQPSVNQIEFHPYLQRQGLIPFHNQQKILTVCYGPLTPVMRAQGGPLDELLASLSQKYSATHEQILLRWIIDRGCVPVTTSSKQTRLVRYLHALNFQLTAEEVEQISDTGHKKHHRAFWEEKFAADDRS